MSLKRKVQTALPEAKAIKTAENARHPKRKVAVLIGYSGTGYHGMQINDPHKTIEGDLFKALVEAGAISKDNADDPKKSSLVRAARTDKGVHAAGNVVSLKLIIEDPNLVEKINQCLPAQIRVWAISRTNKAFECRRLCCSRIYEYLLPTYTLLSPRSSTALGQELIRTRKTCPPNAAQFSLLKEAEEFWNNVSCALKIEGLSTEEIARLEVENALLSSKSEQNDGTIKESAEINGLALELSEKRKIFRDIENKYRRAYRVDPRRVELLRNMLRQYDGVHNFHNFTVGKNPKDPSAIRVMKSLTVGEPQILNGTEWISIKIHGQSFMLHQIRKMIALAVLAVRMGVPEERITKLYENSKVSIPKAPALGLLLERPVYEAYNERLANFGYGPISFEPFEQKIKDFKKEYIYRDILHEEAESNVFHAFFEYMDTLCAPELVSYLLKEKDDLEDSVSDDKA